MGGWNNLAVACIEVEQGEQIVYVAGGKEVRHSQSAVEPARHRDIGVSTDGLPSRQHGFLDLHEYTVRVRVKVEQ